jgi:hypothetical protein
MIPASSGDEAECRPPGPTGADLVDAFVDAWWSAVVCDHGSETALVLGAGHRGYGALITPA